MKIPRNSKKVFEGVIFDVHQWEQELFDGSFAIFEAVSRMANTVTIAVHNEKFLVIEQEQPARGKYLALPGGRVEEGEDPKDAVKRELMEEVGMEFKSVELYKEINVVPKVDFSTFVFVAKDVERQVEPQVDAGERIVFKWVDFDEFLDVVTDDRFQNLFFANDVMRMMLDGKKLEGFRNMLGL